MLTLVTITAHSLQEQQYGTRRLISIVKKKKKKKRGTPDMSIDNSDVQFITQSPLLPELHIEMDRTFRTTQRGKKIR